MAAMNPKISLCKQDNATDFIWPNALRLKVATRVQRKK